MSATNEQDNDATAAQILDDAEKDHRGPGTADSSHQIHPATQPAETEEVYDRTTTGEHPKVGERERLPERKGERRRRISRMARMRRFRSLA